MQAAVSGGATSTARGHTSSNDNTTTTGVLPRPSSSSSAPPPLFSQNRNPSPLIFMNHTPRTTPASTTTIVTPSTRTRSTSAELLYEDGAPPAPSSSSSSQPADVEHVHLLEGRDPDTADHHRPQRGRKNGPFPTNDDEDSSSPHSSSSSSRDRSGAGSLCWWSLPDPPFWGPETSATTRPPTAVARKPLTVDTSVAGGADRRPSLPIQSLSEVRPAAATRDRRFSWEELGPQTQQTQTTKKGGVGQQGGGRKRAMKMPPPVTVPPPPQQQQQPRVEQAGGQGQGQYTRFDLADFLRNTGPEMGGLGVLPGVVGGGGTAGRRGGAGAGGGGSARKHRSALRFLGYKRRKSLAERVGTVEG